ncbi:MAG: nucleotidyl transferase AbiEii/AbiGii toxin family protein [Verrucomicrobia bacterium]|nr:nucleotidyl transferase AbiEii/AbiGii toxin family protein [Verrucomicrobiota bacterium]
MSPFEPDALVRDLGLNATFMTGQAEGCLQLRINNIKVEFLRHAYPKLAEDDHVEGIRLWSLQDVAAMKLNAIANRGSKKDFYDIVALLEHFALQSMIDLYQAKYRPASLMMVIKSLAWFVDADAEPDPITLRDQSWHEVKEIISSAIRSLR